jgi:hypothetical protein
MTGFELLFRNRLQLQSPWNRAARTRRTHSQGFNMTPYGYIKLTYGAGRGPGISRCRKSSAAWLLPFWKRTCKLSTCGQVLPNRQGFLNYRMHKTPKRTTRLSVLPNLKTFLHKAQKLNINHVDHPDIQRPPAAATCLGTGILGWTP